MMTVAQLRETPKPSSNAGNAKSTPHTTNSPNQKNKPTATKSNGTGTSSPVSRNSLSHKTASKEKPAAQTRRGRAAGS